MKNYIPYKDSELVAWNANFTAQVRAGATLWGITPAEVSDLQDATLKQKIIKTNKF
ncbi:MAG: hypothetical protein LBS69_03535 [Prevotellaceae bacterium]|nr:hypothetical protein [Prevotellaceae bacterium]